MVSELDELAAPIDTMPGVFDPAPWEAPFPEPLPHWSRFPQHLTFGDLPPGLSEQGQFPHGVADATDLVIAAQKALPNGSSAHAKQFEGSPEHDGGGAVTGKTELGAAFAGRRRRGTGGW